MTTLWRLEGDKRIVKGDDLTPGMIIQGGTVYLVAGFDEDKHGKYLIAFDLNDPESTHFLTPLRDEYELLLDIGEKDWLVDAYILLRGMHNMVELYGRDLKIISGFIKAHAEKLKG